MTRFMQRAHNFYMCWKYQGRLASCSEQESKQGSVLTVQAVEQRNFTTGQADHDILYTLIELIKFSK